MNSPTALITGAHGFIGRYTARYFSRQGWNVVGIGLGSWTPDEHAEWGITDWHEATIDVESILNCGVKPNAVVHCAGSGSVGYSVASPYDDFLMNVETAAAMLEYVRRYAPDAAVVAISSAAVYGAAKQLPIPEVAPLAPVSPYGFHKMMMETLCASYSSNFGLRTAIVRLFSIYGNGLRKQLLWDACNKVSKGATDFNGNGTEVRDWLHVEDAVRLLYAAADHASDEAPVVNGGTGVGTSIRDVLQELFRVLGKSDPPRFIGAPRPGDPDSLVADYSRAKSWNWTPGINWRSGVREYAEWFNNLRQ